MSEKILDMEVRFVSVVFTQQRIEVRERSHRQRHGAGAHESCSHGHDLDVMSLVRHLDHNRDDDEGSDCVGDERGDKEDKQRYDACANPEAVVFEDRRYFIRDKL